MPNTSKIIGQVNVRDVDVPYTIYTIQTSYDTTADHTVLTAGGTLTNDVTGTTTTLPQGRWYIVGIDYLDSVSRTMTIKSGTRPVLVETLPAGGGVGIGVGSVDYWVAGKSGEALVVNLSANASPSLIYWHVVVSNQYKGYSYD
jgi:hypothetical protein